MTPTDDERIRALVKQLDDAVPREGDVVVDANPDDEGCTVVKANRTGYLRLGIELLKAADAPLRSEVRSEMLELDLSYLTGLEGRCYSFERHQDVRARRASKSDSGGTEEGPARGACLVLALVAVFMIVSLLVGAIAVLRWLGQVFF
jgi:hypothetical protein